jgi:hypothetical protein
MDSMDEHLSVLEQHQDLEPSIIKETKVNKLLKVILKIASIPRDEEFKFKERCQKLLTAWTQIMNGEADKPKHVAPNGLANGKKEESNSEKVLETSAETAVNGKAESPDIKKDEETVTTGVAEGSKAEESVESA